MNVWRISLEILKLVISKESVDDLNDKTRTILENFQGIYQEISKIARTEDSTGETTFKIESALEILKIVTSNESFDNLNFSEKTNKVLESFIEIYVQISKFREFLIETAEGGNGGKGDAEASAPDKGGNGPKGD